MQPSSTLGAKICALCPYISCYYNIKKACLWTLNPPLQLSRSSTCSEHLGLLKRRFGLDQECDVWPLSHHMIPSDPVRIDCRIGLFPLNGIWFLNFFLPPGAEGCMMLSDCQSRKLELGLSWLGRWGLLGMVALSLENYLTHRKYVRHHLIPRTSPSASSCMLSSDNAHSLDTFSPLPIQCTRDTRDVSHFSVSGFQVFRCCS